jgi:hypothetical protein
MSKSFIDAVEQRARQLGEGSTPTEGDWRQALTETLAAAGPVAWRRWDNDYGHWVYYETNLDDAEQLFTAPPADARDARIADGQGETYYKKYLLLSSQYTREIEALTDQLAAAQAALAEQAASHGRAWANMTAIVKTINDGALTIDDLRRRLDTAVSSTDQSAAGSEAA